MKRKQRMMARPETKGLMATAPFGYLLGIVSID
jgi:hypothetical protein